MGSHDTQAISLARTGYSVYILREPNKVERNKKSERSNELITDLDPSRMVVMLGLEYKVR